MASVSVQELRASFDRELSQARTREALESLRTGFLGKKAGRLSSALKGLGALAPDERARHGQELNELKRHIEERLAELALRLSGEESRRVTSEALAALYAPVLPARGSRHPLVLLRQQLEDLFLELGFGIADGPEVEDDFHNFAALNVPEDHPARDMQDTLYLGPGSLLRTHTSNVQIRTLRSAPPPHYIITTGRCYRRDTADLTHSPMFHQIEGLVVDRGIGMADLKGTLEHVAQRLFGSTEVRLRPSYFPFTEPSAELDISCFACRQGGCALCKHSGFIELGGCGLVDPNVFEAVGIDPEAWSGYAFGFGIERAAMLKYGIDSIRLFFENDLRFLRQFPARA